MNQSKPKTTRSIKDILVSHEERLQMLSQQLERSGGNIGARQDATISTKMKQTEELNKKLMMNQRTFNNSLQLLNGRLSKMEQLFLEFTLDLKKLKKEQENNVSLTIQEEETKEEANEETTEETKEEATEETTTQEAIEETTTQEATEETTQETTEEIKEEVKKEVIKAKKEKNKERGVVIDENKNEEF